MQGCLKAYDLARANGALPLVNSITEHRWDLMDLYKPFGPFKVIVMASERVDDGVANPNKTAERFSPPRRAALRLKNDYGLAMDDIFIDISISAVVADTTGLHRATLAAIRAIRSDPELKHPHHGRADQYRRATSGKEAADGSDLKLSLECAFLTLAVPLGFDAVLATPWRPYQPLPEDNYILCAYRIFSNRPAATRCAQCENSTRRERAANRERAQGLTSINDVRFRAAENSSNLN